ncbi:MAG: YqgE/AlgH family protein [bacterium]|nr:YqgE/AlgH family protein [bacterium]
MLLALLLSALPVASGDPWLGRVTTGPQSERPARGKLLVAAQSLQDPPFARSVVLLVSHDAEDGSMGVIVNQPLDVTLAKILPDVTHRRDRLWRGGPILTTSLLTLIRHPKNVADTEPLFADVRMLTSRVAFERALASDVPADRLRAFAGHAGWAPGQLETELARGDWSLMPATAEIVFATEPARVWPKLMQRGNGEWTRLRAPQRVAQAR